MSQYPSCRSHRKSGSTVHAWVAALAVALTVGQPGNTADNRPGPASLTHWSLQPVLRPAVPDLSSTGLSTSTPIDAFIAEPLAAKKLGFAPPADRRAWIRRLYLVMHGLPPTPAEVEEFVNDPHANADERLVDRVLASPRYGERWGRHWLDVVRYADSNGFETNRERKNAYPYRDYVIASLNSDKPYDQFVREQIAGDAEGADAATGFLVAGAYDIVKSPDINLTLMQRQDELADIVNTTGTTFLGLTLGCARCHDHKFDPVSQRDYYALQAVFAGVQFGERPLPKAPDPSEQRELAALQAERISVDAALTSLREKSESTRQGSNSTTKALRPPVQPRLNEETFPPIAARSVRFTILASGGAQPCLDELEIFDATGTNVALASLGAKPSASGSLSGYAIHKLEHLNDGRAGNDHSWISDTTDSGWVQIDLPALRQIQRIQWGRDRENRFKDRLATAYRIEAAGDNGQWQEIASSRDRAPVGTEVADAFLLHLSRADAEAARAHQARLKVVQSRIATLTQGPTAWLGTFSQPGETHRLYRGDPLIKRELVGPDTVAVLGALGLSTNAPEQQRRQRLANWIASPTNPLTARVIANRVWHYIFGIGLVDTPSDFGGNGTRPTHPQLLDWLAHDLVRNGWSLKHLQKQILLSRTFRQSSTPRADGLAADAEARLLWRFPPRRLEAEAIRDCFLAASGVLDVRMGGPGFYLQRVEPDNVNRYFPKESFTASDFRRMVYLTRIRQEQDSVFGAFDCPSGNQVMPRRTRSNTPLQALNLLNSAFVLQQSDLLADRLRQEAGSSPTTQVARAFQLMYGRDPDPVEREISSSMIRDHGLTAFNRALYNTSEFLFVF